MEIKNIVTDTYKLSMVKTSKFKTTRIQIAFLSDMTNTITSRSLLPYLLRAVSEEYPKRDILSTYLEEMYAAQFGVSLSKVGRSHGISFDLSVIDDLYTTNNESLFKKGLEFMKSIIFKPLFKEDIYNEEHRLLKEHFESYYSNKMKYAADKHIENMFEDELYRFSALGSLEDLKTVSISSVKEQYDKMIAEDSVYITIVGNIDFDSTEEMIKSLFTFSNENKERVLIDTETSHKNKLLEIIEQGTINQSKLVIGYRTNIRYADKDYYPMLVFNALFGGSSDSLLFSRIREEMGKVYFINTAYDPYKGVLLVYSGINKLDYTDVLEAIDNVLETLCSADYPEELLERTKTVIKNSVNSSLDSTYSLIGRYYKASLFDKVFDLEEVINNIEKVSVEDISLVAKELKKDTIFFLKDDGNNEKV